MGEGGSWLSRAWQKERLAWTSRPNLWKFYLFQTALMVLLAVSAYGRGDRWFTGLCAAGALLAAVLTRLAYKATRAT